MRSTGNLSSIFNYFNLSNIDDYVNDFCPLPDPDIGPSFFLCTIKHTSFHFCAHSYLELDRVVLGSNPAAATLLRNFAGGNSVYPTLPVSFRGDTKSRRSLLSGVYARGSK